MANVTAVLVDPSPTGDNQVFFKFADPSLHPLTGEREGVDTTQPLENEHAYVNRGMTSGQLTSIHFVEYSETIKRASELLKRLERDISDRIALYRVLKRFAHAPKLPSKPQTLQLGPAPIFE